MGGGGGGGFFWKGLGVPRGFCGGGGEGGGGGGGRAFVGRCLGFACVSFGGSSMKAYEEGYVRFVTAVA